MGTEIGGWGWQGSAYLGGIWLQGMQLVHSETELVEVDVDVDQQVGGEGRGEHTLEARGSGGGKDRQVR